MALMQGNMDQIEPYDAEHANFIIDVQGSLETLHRSGLGFGTCGGHGPIDVQLGHHTADRVASTAGDELPPSIRGCALVTKQGVRAPHARNSMGAILWLQLSD
jgi:hypothetical protein